MCAVQPSSFVHSTWRCRRRTPDHPRWSWSPPLIPSLRHRLIKVLDRPLTNEKSSGDHYRGCETNIGNLSIKAEVFREKTSFDMDVSSCRFISSVMTRYRRRRLLRTRTSENRCSAQLFVLLTMLLLTHGISCSPKYVLEYETLRLDQWFPRVSLKLQRCPQLPMPTRYNTLNFKFSLRYQCTQSTWY